MTPLRTGIAASTPARRAVAAAPRRARAKAPPQLVVRPLLDRLAGQLHALLTLPQGSGSLLARPHDGVALLIAAGALLILMATSAATLRRLLRVRDQT